MKAPLFFQTWLPQKGATFQCARIRDKELLKWAKEIVLSWNDILHIPVEGIQTQVVHPLNTHVLFGYCVLKDNEDFGRRYLEIVAVLLEQPLEESSEDIFKRLCAINVHQELKKKNYFMKFKVNVQRKIASFMTKSIVALLVLIVIGIAVYCIPFKKIFFSTENNKNIETNPILKEEIDSKVEPSKIQEKVDTPEERYQAWQQAFEIVKKKPRTLESWLEKQKEYKIFLVNEDYQRIEKSEFLLNTYQEWEKELEKDNSFKIQTVPYSNYPGSDSFNRRVGEKNLAVIFQQYRKYKHFPLQVKCTFIMSELNLTVKPHDISNLIKKVYINKKVVGFTNQPYWFYYMIPLYQFHNYYASGFKVRVNHNIVLDIANGKIEIENQNKILNCRLYSVQLGLNDQYGYLLPLEEVRKYILQEKWNQWIQKYN
ncbi:MAG TPA: hypothetical protein P5543_02370 [Planctomycetota bacterium]|mgnify:FL=1|nr:hypothetical protein [Planctomycetota bacterium]